MKLFFIAVACMILLVGCTAPQEKDVTQEASDLIAKGKGGTWKVTYNYTHSYTGENLSFTKLGRYFKPGMFRTDIFMVQDNENFDTRLYWLFDGDYGCMRTNDSNWTCVKANRSFNFSADLIFEVTERIILSNKAYPAEPIQILGITSKCYKYQVTKGSVSDSVRYCISDEGVLVYLKSIEKIGIPLFEKEEMNEIIATSYSTQVSDSDFELPGPVKNESG